MTPGGHAVNANDIVLNVGTGQAGVEVATTVIKAGVRVPLPLFDTADRLLAQVTAPPVSDFYQRLHKKEIIAAARTEPSNT